MIYLLSDGILLNYLVNFRLQKATLPKKKLVLSEEEETSDEDDDENSEEDSDSEDDEDEVVELKTNKKKQISSSKKTNVKKSSNIDLLLELTDCECAISFLLFIQRIGDVDEDSLL